MNMPSHNHKPLSLTVPAPGGARIAAYVVDLVLLGILNYICKNLNLPGILSYVVPIFYFVFTHKKFGQSLGKYLLGLKIISVQDHEPTIRSLIFRETFGRGISVVVFGIGYLQALLAQDSRGWHDLISHTRVISIRATSRTSAMPIWQSLGLSVGVLGLICFVFFYSLFFTKWPLTQAAERLALAGIEFKGLKGSIAKGFYAENLILNSEQLKIDLTHAKFEYDFFESVKHPAFTIQNVSVSSGHIEFLKSEKPIAHNKKPDEVTSADAKPKARDDKQAKFLIEKVDFANITVKYLDKMPLVLNRVYAEHIDVDLQKGFDLKQLWVDTSLGHLNISEIQLTRDQFSMGKMAVAQLKSLGSYASLRQDLKMEIKTTIGFNPYVMKDLYFSALDRRLQLKNAGAGFIAQTYGLKLDQFFNGVPPIQDLNLKFEGLLWPPMPKDPSAGAFTLMNRAFGLNAKGHYSYVTARESFEIAINWKSLFKAPNPADPLALPPIEVYTEKYKEAVDWLAQLYFEKPTAQLTPEQVQIIARDKDFFKIVTPPTVMPELLRLPSSLPPPTKNTPQSR